MCCIVRCSSSWFVAMMQSADGSWSSTEQLQECCTIHAVGWCPAGQLPFSAVMLPSHGVDRLTSPFKCLNLQSNEQTMTPTGHKAELQFAMSPVVNTQNSSAGSCWHCGLDSHYRHYAQLSQRYAQAAQIHNFQAL